MSSRGASYPRAPPDQRSNWSTIHDCSVTVANLTPTVRTCFIPGTFTTLACVRVLIALPRLVPGNSQRSSGGVAGLGLKTPHPAQIIGKGGAMILQMNVESYRRKAALKRKRGCSG
jgi:hypothetical protein